MPTQTTLESDACLGPVIKKLKTMKLPLENTVKKKANKKQTTLYDSILKGCEHIKTSTLNVDLEH